MRRIPTPSSSPRQGPYNPMHIVLVEPQIPPNTGNIARLCVGTNTPLHLIEPLGFSIDDKQLKRAGLDYWSDLELYCHPNLDALKTKVPGARFLYFSKKAHWPYTQIRFYNGDYLVFGSETTGLPEALLRDEANAVYTIPMFGPVRSLNLSTAVGIVLYEALRQVKGL